MAKHIKTGILAFETNPISQYLLLAAITLLAAALRFYKLGEWSFWIDEMFTIRDAQNAFNDGLGRLPISFMLIHVALDMLGTSEWSARLVPALIGILSIPTLYFPLRKMVGSVTALMAGLLLAVSPWHLYWSQNARFYGLMLLFYTLALFTFYFGLEQDRPWYLLLSVFLLGLAANERMVALLFMPVVMGYIGLLIILPFEKPSGLRPGNLAFFFLPALLMGLLYTWEFAQQPARWLDLERINNNPFWILAGVIYYVGIPTVCLGALGALYLLIKKDRLALLLSLGAVVPLLVIMLQALLVYAANRYVFISLISWLILASVAARELFRQTEKNARILAVGALLILLLAPLGEDVLYYRYQNGNRDDWKAAFALVKQHREAGDLVVSSGYLLGNFYLQEETIAMEGMDLARVEDNGGRTWFVEDMNVPERWPEVHDWLQANAQLVANMDVPIRARNFKMRVYLYDPDNRGLPQKPDHLPGSFSATVLEEPNNLAGSER